MTYISHHIMCMETCNLPCLSARCLTPKFDKLGSSPWSAGFGFLSDADGHRPCITRGASLLSSKPTVLVMNVGSNSDVSL